MWPAAVRFRQWQRRLTVSITITASIWPGWDMLPSVPMPEALEHGANLSGGQRQRISIARALIRNPQVIILDEATSALDSISESEIQEALERLTKGRTTFIVAHRLSTVRGADRILVIGQGRIREQGSYQELMAKKGEFYQMEQLQRMVR